MLKSSTRIVAPLMLALSFSLVASAQQGDTGTGAQTTESLGAGSATELDADSAFSSIERGDTVGASQNTGQGFSEADDAGGGTGGLGGAGGLGGGGFGGLGGFGGFQSLFGGGTAGSTTNRPIIRTRLRSAIKTQPIAPQQRQRVASQRLRSLPSGNPMRGVNVMIEGQTAVITGIVPSNRERRMSELLLRLEPGIRNVDNRVTVAQ